MRIDTHVHIVGNGLTGSGCSLNVQNLYHRVLARYMLHLLKLPPSIIKGALDQTYVELLVRWLRESSLEKIVILAHDRIYDESGKMLHGIGSFYVPNDYVLELARLHPEFLPAVSIHPARADALDELERAIESGAVMMKCLPNCHNIDCNNPKYAPFWTKMAENQIVLLAHTGGELSVPVVNRAYQNPNVLRLPLECGVTVIAAHCATASHPLDRDYTDTFIEMLTRYPNLYGDNSALNTPFRSKHYRKLLAHGVEERIVHGSDLPIPISAFWVWLRGLVSREGYQRATAETNLLERDVVVKKALGFSEASFSRLSTLLRIAHSKSRV